MRFVESGQMLGQVNQHPQNKTVHMSMNAPWLCEHNISLQQ
jgi:hypothetical protein